MPAHCVWVCYAQMKNSRFRSRHFLSFLPLCTLCSFPYSLNTQQLHTTHSMLLRQVYPFPKRFVYVSANRANLSAIFLTILIIRKEILSTLKPPWKNNNKLFPDNVEQSSLLLFLNVSFKALKISVWLEKNHTKPLFII